VNPAARTPSKPAKALSVDRLRRLPLPVALVVASIAFAPRARADGRNLAVPASSFRYVARESGPVDYYRVVEENGDSFLRAEYVPPTRTAVHGFEVPASDRRAYHKLRWRWRARVLPDGGDECRKGRADSAAAVYATWKRGVKWWVLKFTWSANAARGALCEPHDVLVYHQRTIVLESGGPVGVWRDESVDLDAAFRLHFADGDPDAEVPELFGVGMMTDGDQTKSPSSADYGGFVLEGR
jgi:hypothetical protein